jgi:hypothetical protein
MKNVLVMGCPRSGTSLITKVFSEHGWDIGERCRNSLAHRDPSCYEDPVMVQTNYQIFSGNEAHPMMPCDHIEATISEQSVKVLTEDKKEPWVIKDPSLCVTYPFWQQYFPDCWIVAALRHPVPAIESMRQRSHFPTGRFAKVWWRYTQNAFTWGETYGGMSWVHFPSLKGLSNALEEAGGQYDREIVEKVYDKKMVHGEVQKMEPSFGYMEKLHSKILMTRIPNRKKGWSYYE